MEPVQDRDETSDSEVVGIDSIRYSVKISVIIASVLLTFVVVEVAYRFSFSTSELREKYLRNCNVFQYTGGNIQFHATLGYINAPNLDVRFENPEYTTRIQTNSLGFRDDEAAIAEAEVLFLGDSFCFGWGVDEDDNCSRHFENISGKRVLNMGVSGYGTVQQFLLLKEFGESGNLEGQIAIFLFYPNDIVESEGYLPGLYPAIVSNSSRFYTTEPFEDAFQDWFFVLEDQTNSFFGRHSCLWDRVRSVSYHDKKVRLASTIRERHPELPKMQDVLLGRELFDSLFHEINEFSGKNNIVPVFALIPPLPSVESTQDWAGGQLIRMALERAAIKYVELGITLGPEDYFQTDCHWNTNGHKKAAKRIHQYLIGNGML